MSVVLDFLYGIFKKPYALANISSLTGHIDDIIHAFEEEYVNDPNLKNAAIDAVVKLLESYKVPEISTK